jgi:hypothetical protein
MRRLEGLVTRLKTTDLVVVEIVPAANRGAVTRQITAPSTLTDQWKVLAQ